MSFAGGGGKKKSLKDNATIFFRKVPRSKVSLSQGPVYFIFNASHHPRFFFYFEKEVFFDRCGGAVSIYKGGAAVTSRVS